MPRKKRDFGLPRLTVQEAARLLGVEYEPFKVWAFERLKPAYEEWSRWNNVVDIANTNKSRPLPEAIIRLWLTSQLDGAVVSPPVDIEATQARMRQALQRLPARPAAAKATRRKV